LFEEGVVTVLGTQARSTLPMPLMDGVLAKKFSAW
jgi:hypothetical protein